jgi:hypothetical protein
VVTPLVILILAPLALVCWAVDTILQARSDRKARRG